MNSERIEVGDIVNVWLTTADEHIAGALVLAMPSGADECWILRDSIGHILYVQNFEMIQLKSKGMA